MPSKTKSKPTKSVKASAPKAASKAPASKSKTLGKAPAKQPAKAAKASSVKPSKAKPASKPAAAAKAKPAAAKPAAKVAEKAAQKKPAASLKTVVKETPKAAQQIHAGAKGEAKPKPEETKLGTKPEPKLGIKIKPETMKPVKQPETAKTKPVEAAPAEARKEEKKPAAPKPIFKTKEYVVYPSHGVGQILDIQEQEIAGTRLELFVINFDKEKMTLRVPTHKAQAVGMRKLADASVVNSALETLRGRARIKRTMWSRRAQEYEAKINSGDLISIAEVVRDLYRSERQPEQSYSERQLYEAALDRMAREVAVVERIGEDAAVQRVETALQGGSGRGDKPAKIEVEIEEDETELPEEAA